MANVSCSEAFGGEADCPLAAYPIDELPDRDHPAVDAGKVEGNPPRGSLIQRGRHSPRHARCDRGGKLRVDHA
eukprot:6252046-Lingulodinium_polyedra.AAC.1